MDTTKIIYAKSKEHLSKGNRYWVEQINFIKKIKDINVFTFIVVSIEQITFYIVSESNPKILLFSYIFKLNSYSEKSIKAFVNHIKKTIITLEFDKLFGVFISKNSKSPKPLFYDEIGLNFIPNDNCISCQNQTLTKLSCNHFCCHVCWSELNKKCKNCNNISSNLISNVPYYSFENKFEFNSIKRWMESNKFFPTNILNKFNYHNNNNFEQNDWDNDDDYSDYSDYSDDDDYSDYSDSENDTENNIDDVENNIDDVEDDEDEDEYEEIIEHNQEQS